MRVSGEFDAMPKKEALLLGRELEKLQKNLGGIRGMSKRPDAVFVLDTKKEHIAVTEANKLGIPVIAVVDTNVDPDVIQYPIPGNDDAIRANALMCRVIAEAIEEGRYIASKRNPQAAAGAAAAAPRTRPRSPQRRPTPAARPPPPRPSARLACRRRAGRRRHRRRRRRRRRGRRRADVADAMPPSTAGADEATAVAETHGAVRREPRRRHHRDPRRAES